MSTPGEYLYNARFTASASIYSPSVDERHEARASLDQMKELLPAGIDPATDMDLIYIVGNLAVGGVVNLNDDAVTLDDMLAMYTRFERRQCNVEHNRAKIVGHIIKAGLSEMGTNRLITPDEARAAGRPFNIATVAVVYKVADKDLCDYILQAGAPGSPDKDALSLSFEVGFNEYSIAVLPPDTTDLRDATATISPDSPDFDRYNRMLRINKGSGKVGKTGQRVARVLQGSLAPLGQGIVTIPAAAVKGIAPILEASDSAALDIAPPTEAVMDDQPDPESRADQVYITSTSPLLMHITKANRVKIPAGLMEKAKSLNYPKADVTLSDGRVLKGITVFSGEELDLDAQLNDLQGVVITDMNPQMAPQIDDSPVVHPHIDDTFPTKDPLGRADDIKQEVIKHFDQNRPYTDATLLTDELKASIISSLSSVSPLTTNPNQSPSMKLEDLKQLEAKVKTATKPEEITEAFANVSLFAQEIMKASEEYSKAADKAKSDKDEADKTVEAMKTELAEAKKTLQELKDAKASAEAEASFQNRMTVMASEVEMDDEARAFVAEDVRACVDDAAFAKFLAKSKKIMKSKNAKTADDKHGSQGKDADPKVGKHTVDTQNDDATAAAKTAIASAQANPVDGLNIDPMAGTAVAPESTFEQYKKAFAGLVSIGGRSLKDLTAGETVK